MVAKILERIPYRAMAAATFLVVALLAVFGQTITFDFQVWGLPGGPADLAAGCPASEPDAGRLLWTSPRSRFVPVSSAFFAAESAIAQRCDGKPLDGRVFHAGSLLLHIGCTLMVFVVLRRLWRHDGAACLGALFFGLHPLQVESVAWIAETRGLLCALFCLVAFWLFSHVADLGAGRKAYIWLGCASLAFLLALLSKPAAVALPLVIFVLETGVMHRPMRRAAIWLAPWMVVSLAWLLFVWEAQAGTPAFSSAAVWARPFIAGDSLLFYLHKLAAPLLLAPDYGHTPQWLFGHAWAYFAWIVPVLAVVVLACLPHRGVWLCGAGIFAAWLLPTLGLTPFAAQRFSVVADRYVYLGMLGPTLVLTWFLAYRWRSGAVGLTLAALTLLGVASFLQTSHWKDAETLLRYSLGVNPKSVVANYNYGCLLAERQEFLRAEQCYRKALETDPNCAEAHLKLGVTLSALGQAEESQKQLREAARLNPELRNSPRFPEKD